MKDMHFIQHVMLYMSPAGWYQSRQSHADKFLKVTNPGNDNFDWAGLVFLFLPF